MKIRVTTQQLRAAADEASGYIDKVSKQFEQIESIVNATAGYWEGDGQAAFRKSYTDRLEKIEKALRGFQDNVDDLRKIAGIYEVTEEEAAESVEPLLSDVIV